MPRNMLVERPVSMAAAVFVELAPCEDETDVDFVLAQSGS